MTRVTSSWRLISFFDPSQCGSDLEGRTLADIIAWPDQELEFNHDYIQTTFPLPEGSRFNASVWLVDAATYEAFRDRPELRLSLEHAFARIYAFYGLKNTEAAVRPTSDHTTQAGQIVRADNFDINKRFWVSRFNHNHLRITRILRSLRVLGLDTQAKMFHSFLETDPEVAAKVSPRSKMYWKRAAERPLHLPPDEEDESAEGIRWLRELQFP